MKNKIIEGFSKLTKEEKINWLTQQYVQGSNELKNILKQYWNQKSELQKIHDEFTENTISNFYIPYGIAPNFLINNEIYAIPMATEESSVVAAAAKSAKFWLNKGGFKTKLLGNIKLGHVHFIYKGNKAKLQQWFQCQLKEELIKESIDITKNMRIRGGGITDIELVDKTEELESYFQIKGSFNTQDSMGANFIN